MAILTQTPTISTTAYQAGDAVGGLLTFDLGSGAGSKPVVVRAATILDNQATPDNANLLLHLFRKADMAAADHAALAVSLADFQNGDYIQSLDFSIYETTVIGVTGATVARLEELSLIVIPEGGKLYGQLACVGAPTFGAADALTVALDVVNY